MMRKGRILSVPFVFFGMTELGTNPKCHPELVKGLRLNPPFIHTISKDSGKKCKGE